MPTTQQGYSSAKFMLEIEGVLAGFLFAVEGGESFAAVISEPEEGSGVLRKHVGAIEFAPISMSFGTGMSELLYDWIAGFLNRESTARNGAIVLLDYKFNERSRLEFDGALITEVAFPALDGGSKDRVHFVLTIQPAASRVSNAAKGSIPGFGAKTKKDLIGSNFRLKLDKLETACAKVNMIEAIVVKQSIARSEEGLTPTVLEVPNLVFTLAESEAPRFYDWFEDFVRNGNSAPENERAGTLEFLDPSMKTALFTLTLSNVGIFRIRNERSVGGADVIGRVRVELYCEEMAFNSTSESNGSVVTSPIPRSSASVSGTRNLNAPLAETLVGIIDDRIGGEEALRTALRIAASAEVTGSNERAESELIARRLLATVRPVVVGTAAPRRDEGASIGERWATEKATLEELNQVSALESGDWTAMRLEGEHSLIAELAELGVIPPGGDGPMDLERDNFVEGIVAGASQVLRRAAPHLSRPTSQK